MGSRAETRVTGVPARASFTADADTAGEVCVDGGPAAETGDPAVAVGALSDPEATLLVVVAAATGRSRLEPLAAELVALPEGDALASRASLKAQAPEPFSRKPITPPG